MYSRSVSVIRSKRITAAAFQVPPYTSGLQTPSSEAFSFSRLMTYAKIMRKSLLSLLLLGLILTGESVASESWGSALFKTKRHDFGRVALGANAEFRFELTNTYKSDVELLNVQSSCSCSSAELSTPLLKPGESGAVIVRLNTSGQHLRDKSAVLTVQLASIINGFRRIDTVQLFVSGYIRPDVVITPGSIEFGAVAEGITAERTVRLEYAGRPGWALVKVERSLPFVHAKAEEISREQGNVVYKITVSLRDNAPVGFFKDALRLTTNELQQGKAEPVELVLPVQGVVTSPMQAKPSPILIGVLTPGDTVSKSMVIRNETPFRIIDVKASDDRFRFAFADQESTVQLVSVSFSARQIPLGQSQDIAEVIRISTNDPRQKSVTVNAVVRVVP